MKKIVLFISFFLSFFVTTAFAENYDQNYLYNFKIVPWYFHSNDVSLIIPNPHGDNRLIFIQIDDYSKVNIACNGRIYMDIQNEFTCKTRGEVRWSNALSRSHSSGTFQITPIL